MSHEKPKAKPIFAKALEIEEPEARESYLDDACGGNAELRAEVADLLAAFEQAGSFLKKPAVEADTKAFGPTVDMPAVAEAPGQLIGRYKLLQQIGEGGMGSVYMAEQEKPIRRKVALKIIKLGMDSKQVIARFEAERQALALMEHQNIARVLDAGTTKTGRPYFVMELVKGIPITEYCDNNKLTPRERQVLARLIDGLSNKAIAQALSIGEGTVKVHLKAVLRKLHVANRTQAATLALRLGWPPAKTAYL